jgi:predicted peptidase
VKPPFRFRLGLQPVLTAVLSLSLAGLSFAEVRDWTSAEGGRKIVAEYDNSGDGKVTIRRESDGKSFTIALDTLSEEDREWVREKEAAMAVENAGKAARESDDNPYMELLTGEWERQEESGLKYRLFADRRLRKPGADDESGAYPLVIYLHGKGGDVMSPEEPWSGQAFSADDNYSKRPCYILVPQCPPSGGWRGESAEAVMTIAKNLVKHLYVDPKRIYLTGYSMGGFGTFHVLAQEPEFFAAGAPVAGGGNPGSAETFKDVPVWIFHGAKDDTVSVDKSRSMVEALKAAGADPKYTEYPDGDHGIIGEVYDDKEFHEWLFSQKKS